MQTVLDALEELLAVTRYANGRAADALAEIAARARERQRGVVRALDTLGYAPRASREYLAALQFLGRGPRAGLSIGPVTLDPTGFLGMAWSQSSTRDHTFSATGNFANRSALVYRDVTLNAGVVMTVNNGTTKQGLQILLCRDLTFANTAAQISANGMGSLGGASNGQGALANIYGLAPPAAGQDGYSLTQAAMANAGAGGASSTTPAVGSDGVAAPPATQRVISALTVLQYAGYGLIGGGSGGVCGAGSTVEAGGAAGLRGASGNNSSTNSGGAGGGSGVGGGGGGGGSYTTTPGSLRGGGSGGGMVLVICRSVKTAAGIVSANGAAGVNGAAGNDSGGGGGGGGYAGLVALNGGTAPTVQANAGAAGTHLGSGANGGAGGAGVAEVLGFD